MTCRSVEVDKLVANSVRRLQARSSNVPGPKLAGRITMAWRVMVRCLLAGLLSDVRCQQQMHWVGDVKEADSPLEQRALSRSAQRASASFSTSSKLL